MPLSPLPHRGRNPPSYFLYNTAEIPRPKNTEQVTREAILMKKTEARPTAKEFAERVRKRTARLVRGIAEAAGLEPEEIDNQLVCGKMLRTLLPGRIVESAETGTCIEALERVCAAAELVHTASLCHDDVIDKSEMRRGTPSLWKRTGRSGAVLVGDLLFSEAIRCILDGPSRGYVDLFADRVREMSATEAEQELVWRGETPDEETHVRLARGKTGPLFALTAAACGGDDERLTAALQEAGYRIGTAYQLADDLVDVIGREEVAGKTLGTDRRRSKYTLALRGEDGIKKLRNHVEELCRTALEHLDTWRQFRRGILTFIAEDLAQILGRHDEELANRLEQMT